MLFAGLKRLGGQACTVDECGTRPALPVISHGGGLLHQEGRHHDDTIDEVCVCREPDVVCAGDLKGVSTSAFEVKTPLRMREVEQDGTLRDLG